VRQSRVTRKSFVIPNEVRNLLFAAATTARSARLTTPLGVGPAWLSRMNYNPRPRQQRL
jgi:hypothetical protein